MMEILDAFNFLSIPRNQNKPIDRLATIGAEFDIPAKVKNDDAQHYVKFFVRLSILDNNIYWQVFDSDEQIINLLIEEAKFLASNQQNLSQKYEYYIL